jgi:hypothetical protein
MRTNKYLAVAALAVVLALSATAYSQIELNDSATKTNPKILGLLPASSFSLLDPSRLDIKNSYSFSYVSSGKYSGSFGLYQTSLGYQVSSPLYLQVDLGYLHQPFGLKNNLDLNSRFFPNFHLYFNPNSNFSFSVDVLTGPSNNYDYFWHRRER